MIAGLVLAAGQSKRMGAPKLTMPWAEGRTVVGCVVAALRGGGVGRILVVVGAERAAVEAALAGEAVETVVNERFAEGEMLLSIQVGLRAMPVQAQAAMIVPGDLPAIQPETVAAVADAWRADPTRLCAPVHGGRRGHPVVIPRRLWTEVLALREGESMRSFLRRYEAEIVRVDVPDPGIHKDIDTPEDYRRVRRDG